MVERTSYLVLTEFRVSQNLSPLRNYNVSFCVTALNGTCHTSLYSSRLTGSLAPQSPSLSPQARTHTICAVLDMLLISLFCLSSANWHGRVQGLRESHTLKLGFPIRTEHKTMALQEAMDLLEQDLNELIVAEQKI